jgi:hypothetical protein
MSTKVHRIVVSIVDHDELGAAEVASVLESANYPNDCIGPRVVSTDTREVEWADDHPLNRRGWERAFEELFDLSDVDDRPTYGCNCGPMREEYVSHNDTATFHPQVGCLRCDRWDGPPRLRKP